MFRVGSVLFIPSYFSVVLYRAFASSSNDGNFILMTGEAGFCVRVRGVCSDSHPQHWLSARN